MIALLLQQIFWQDQRKIEGNGADLLIGGAGVHASVKSNDSKVGFSGLGFLSGNGDLEMHKLQGGDAGVLRLLMKGKILRPFGDVDGAWAEAGNALVGIGHAVMNLLQGFGNKGAEVHG